MDEKLKQKLMVALIAFNVGFVICMLPAVWSAVFSAQGTSNFHYVVAFVVGGILAAVGYKFSDLVM